ncbi:MULTISPECIES: DeoR/GlpR family DNA-binding transcription regulator [unclassified Crossiella]|uniref:DeoR/GlpR family DNA-binding transcription regulator n=1 Tax=unclassified Crossiella TaxID=2620835 RepID=UPI001FFE4B52|nr:MULTISPECIES: DeoR/GlpR family DNA-binding transcription regulator [unclassified Crossiella]MCK2243010.1 DeoR/GlpR family DNA-binding transcription regulator [Crossiella sp. S99.2]MCK2256887.1 DeoR/GlpR family DNA-binding transcription regulator [Crossiella sp. S99.1]
MILTALRERSRATVVELAELTQCSEMTIRRDLDALERDGLLRRVRGAAVSMLAGEETPFAVRSRQHVDAKRRIGLAVAGLLDDGESVVFDSGTTALEAARAAQSLRLTVLPLSLHIATAFEHAEHVHQVLPGGDVRKPEQAFIGPLTEYALDRMRFDTLVLGCCGVSGRDGVTAFDLAESQVKRAAVRASARVVAAVDASKLGRRAFARVCELDALDVLVTDTAAPEDELDQLRKAGVEVHCV